MQDRDRGLRTKGVLGLFALGALSIAAMCSESEQPQPVDPPRFADGPSGALAPEQPTLVPEITPSNPDQTTKPRGERSFRIIDNVTLKSITSSADMLTLRNPDASEALVKFSSAWHKSDTNPDDPTISSDLVEGARSFINMDSICSSPDQVVRDMGVGLAQEVGSWLKLTRPEVWNEVEDEFLDSKCSFEDKGSDPEDENEPEEIKSNFEPLFEGDGFIVVPSSQEGHISVIEPDKKYKLLSEATWANVDVANGFLSVALPATTMNDIKADISAARALGEGDPRATELTMSATAKILNAGANQCPEESLFDIPLKTYASVVYHQDPSSWDENSNTFTDNNCFWGNAGNYQDEFDGLKYGKYEVTASGVRLYTSLTWDDLAEPEDLVNIKATIGADDYPYVEKYLIDGAARYQQNPEDPEIATAINSAGYGLRFWCLKSKFSLEHLRKLASVVKRFHPQKYESFESTDIEPCIAELEK